MMPPRSPAAASAREIEVSGLGLWLVLLLACSLMACVVVLSSLLEPIVDTAWFGLEVRMGIFEQEAVTWVSLLLAALVLRGLAALLKTASLTNRLSRAAEWAGAFLSFLVLVDWVVVIHLLIVVSSGGIQLSFVQAPEILMVSSLAAILWPVCFDLQPFSRAAASIFLISLLVFGLSLVALEPDALSVLLARVGLTGWPPSLVLSSSFLWALAYLVPVPPLLWTAGRAWLSHADRTAD